MAENNNPEQGQPEFPHQKHIIDMDSLHAAVDAQQEIEDSKELRFCNRCSTIIEDNIWCEPCAEEIRKTEGG